MDSDSSSQENQESTLHGHGHVQTSKPDIMQLQHLKEITNNFSDERVLGEGGFGVVYKGVLQNGEMVAVKKLLLTMPNSLKQFENEVDLLMRLKHANIVRLIGYCYEIQNVHMKHNGKFIFAGMPQSLLCLEYLPKGSLDKYISDESSGLDWCTRYKIIVGICNGLHYLHEQIKPIIHLDLKPANILLDDSMAPKVTDFGLSRLLDEEQTMWTLITNGTRGYMPPEYLHGGTITPMSDIFSLGVIILEIVTGHRDYPDVSRTSSDEFIELTVQKWRNVLEKAPACTSLEIYCQQVKRCIQIGLICVNPERTKRPTTTKIIKMLQGLESTDCHTGNEVTSPEAQIRPIPRELLDVDPLELSFSLDPDNRTPCLVKLRNKTDGYVAFHFNVLRARTKYCIEPTVGFVWPRSTFNVVVTMEERQELASDFPCLEEFLVQSIVVRVDRVTSEHITEDTFNNVPCKAVHKVKLAVVYVPPAQPASLLRVGFDEALASDLLRLDESARVGFSQGPVGWQGPPQSPSSYFVKKISRLEIPTDTYPNFNFIGRLLAPRGNSLKRIEAFTGCRVFIRGKGSIEDPRKEEQLKGRRGYEHLDDPLHILIEAEFPANGIDLRLAIAQDMLQESLKPVDELQDYYKRQQLRDELQDYYKRQQLRELAMLNSPLREESLSKFASRWRLSL